jgi:DNA polymerase III delta subunit
MIYIVHGDDFTKSRNLILNQQKKLEIDSRNEMDISNLSPEDLFSHVHSSGLFGENQLLVLNISKAGRTNLEPFLEKLKKIPENIILIILSDKTLTNNNVFVKNASKLEAKVIFNEKTPLSSTFRFVDAVFYRQRDKAYRELSKLLGDQTEPFEIFSMLVWGLRNVAQAKFDNQKFFRGRDFIKNKVYAQSKLFSTESLKKLYKTLSDMDRDVKTGGIDPDLLIPLAVEKVLNS